MEGNPRGHFFLWSRMEGYSSGHFTMSPVEEHTITLLVSTNTAGEDQRSPYKHPLLSPQTCLQMARLHIKNIQRFYTLLCHTDLNCRFHSSLCFNFHQVCCAAHLLRPSSGSPKPSLWHRYAGLLFLADAGTWRSDSAEFSTKKTGTVVASDYVIIVGTPRSRDASCCWTYCAVMDSKRNRWGLPDSRWRSKTGSEL